VIDVWEPWRPEIGQRVRVRVSAECQAGGVATRAPMSNRALRDLIESGGDANGWGVASPQEGHESEIDGVEGTVIAIDRRVEHGHYYRVWFDKPIMPMVLLGLDLAAIELEPVDA
jgi:hypothetical protein